VRVSHVCVCFLNECPLDCLHRSYGKLVWKCIVLRCFTNEVQLLATNGVQKVRQSNSGFHQKMLHIHFSHICMSVYNPLIFLFTTASRPALGPTQPPIQWVLGALPLEVKRSGCEADHSPPSSAEVKNAWSCTSTLSIRLSCVILDNKTRNVFYYLVKNVLSFHLVFNKVRERGVHWQNLLDTALIL
jgi:hypothetical protein